MTRPKLRPPRGPYQTAYAGHFRSPLPYSDDEPAIQLYRLEKARRVDRATPLLNAAKARFEAQMAAEKRVKGGRPKKQPSPTGDL